MAILLGSYTSQNGNNVSSITVSSYVLSAGTPILIVLVQARFPSGTGTFSSVTWNGSENLTQLTSKRQGTSYQAIWYLVNPTATTADVVVTAASENMVPGRVSVRTATGVFTGAPWGTAATNGGTATSGSVTVTSAGDEVVLDGVMNAQSGGTHTVGAGQTADFTNATGGTGNYYFGASTEPGATSVNMGWSWTSSATWNMISAPLKPSGQPITRRTGGVPFARRDSGFGGSRW